jgi:hypothetical protein
MRSLIDFAIIDVKVQYMNLGINKVSKLSHNVVKTTGSMQYYITKQLTTTATNLTSFEVEYTVHDVNRGPY